MLDFGVCVHKDVFALDIFLESFKETPLLRVHNDHTLFYIDKFMRKLKNKGKFTLFYRHLLFRRHST